MKIGRATAWLLNIGHAIDHMFLLIFATAVTSIAAEFGLSRWEDLMPYGAGAFLMFGLGSLPAGRLGDLWGRRAMMLVFFFGYGIAAMICGLASGPWSLAAALTLLGVFSAIYHPVGVPMLVQGALRPGRTLGFNGLVGNLGIALAALVTGLIVQYAGWRLAFVLPGVASLALGVVFARVTPVESEPPARRPGRSIALPASTMVRVVAVMTVTAIASGTLFNFTTNGNGELLRERMAGLIDDPASLGLVLAAVYAVASIAQVVVGRLIDRHPLRRVFLGVVILQAPLFLLAAQARGWALLVLQAGFMVAIFGAIPFTDAMVVRYVDDRMRSRVTGIRLAISFGVSSLAVWGLGPLVKAEGFGALLYLMAGIASVTLCAVMCLPATPPAPLPPKAA